MKFYIVSATFDSDNSDTYCFTSLGEAVDYGNSEMGFDGTFEMRIEEVAVTGENIRRLLGNHGGYCRGLTRVEYRDHRQVRNEKAF